MRAKRALSSSAASAKTSASSALRPCFGAVAPTDQNGCAPLASQAAIVARSSAVISLTLPGGIAEE